MSKLKYEMPTIEFARFESSDVIVSSGYTWSCGTKSGGDYSPFDENCDTWGDSSNDGVVFY